jgi:AcrR family transcriptional regulator
METPSAKRAYNSPLREAQAEVTRKRILDAVGRMMSQPGMPELTFSAIATEAEVAERTIYRHFPTKEAILEAFWHHINAELGMAHYPESVDEILAVMPGVYEGYDKRASLIRAHLSNPAGREMRLQVVPRRQEAYRKILAQELEGADARTVRNAYCVIQLLFSARAWDSISENWGLSGKQAAEACSWAIRILLKEIQRAKA